MVIRLFRDDSVIVRKPENRGEYNREIILEETVVEATVVEAAAVQVALVEEVTEVMYNMLCFASSSFRLKVYAIFNDFYETMTDRWSEGQSDGGTVGRIDLPYQPIHTDFYESETDQWSNKPTDGRILKQITYRRTTDGRTRPLMRLPRCD